MASALSEVCTPLHTRMYVSIPSQIYKSIIYLVAVCVCVCVCVCVVLSLYAVN